MTISNSMEITETIPKELKTLRKKEKLLFTSNFSFFHSVFKRLVLQTRKNKGLFGKGLIETTEASCRRTVSQYNAIAGSLKIYPMSPNEDDEILDPWGPISRDRPTLTDKPKRESRYLSQGGGGSHRKRTRLII